MRKRHERFAIGPAEREAWLAQMGAAMAEAGLDEAARGALAGLFERAAADLVNGPGGRRTAPPTCDVDPSNPPGRWQSS